MSKVVNCILEMLNEDMVSHGWLVQCLDEQSPPPSEWKTVLTELLAGEVEIGEARLASPEYVEFIAWNGTIEERVSRAAKRIESTVGSDQEFAYWLALRKNVDRFEKAAATS